MKGIIVGDLHIRRSSPTARKDNFFETQIKKVQWILEMAEKRLASFVIWPGDLFHHHDMPDVLKTTYIRMFGSDAALTHQLRHFVIFGQHDMRYHSSDRDNTPLGVLLAGGCNVERLNVNTPVELTDGYGHTVHIYGSDWAEEDVPVFDRAPNARYIWVMHRMVVDEKLWEGQTEMIYADDLLESFPEFDLIVTGDNHRTFTASRKVEEEDEVRTTRLVNPGAVMRSTASELAHKPVVYLWDSKTNAVEPLYIPIAPADDVFDTEMVAKEKDRDAKMEAFGKGLAAPKRITTNFRDNVRAYCKENELPKSVLAVIEEIMNESD